MVERQSITNRARQEKSGKVYLTAATAPVVAALIEKSFPHLSATVCTSDSWGRGFFVEVARRSDGPLGVQTYRVWHQGAYDYLYGRFAQAGLL